MYSREVKQSPRYRAFAEKSSDDLKRILQEYALERMDLKTRIKEARQRYGYLNEDMAYIKSILSWRVPHTGMVRETGDFIFMTFRAYLGHKCLPSEVKPLTLCFLQSAYGSLAYNYEFYATGPYELMSEMHQKLKPTGLVKMMNRRLVTPNIVYFTELLRSGLRYYGFVAKFNGPRHRRRFYSGKPHALIWSKHAIPEDKLPQRLDFTDARRLRRFRGWT